MTVTFSHEAKARCIFVVGPFKAYCCEADIDELKWSFGRLSKYIQAMIQELEKESRECSPQPSQNSSPPMMPLPSGLAWRSDSDQAKDRQQPASSS